MYQSPSDLEQADQMEAFKDNGESDRKPAWGMQLSGGPRPVPSSAGLGGSGPQGRLAAADTSFSYLPWSHILAF